MDSHTNEPVPPAHLPHALLTETPLLRTHLLAGLVDGAGVLRSDDPCAVQLPSTNDAFLRQTQHLCRGLGLQASAVQPTASAPALFQLRIRGVDLHQLPLCLDWKRPAASKTTSTVEPFDYDDARCFAFRVQSAGSGDYFGFEVDGNRRFLLSDFTVTHNTSTIAAIVRTLICDPACKILCVARTNTAARHMASACAKFIGPQKLTLQVSTEFFCDWHEDQYTELLDGGYVPGMTGGFDGMYRDHQVLVMTTGICFTKPELTQGRTVVILDEGSQIWDLEAILFLRAMDCLEKLILFGDSKQLSCYVAPECQSTHQHNRKPHKYSVVCTVLIL
jgi:hypothetical protein